MRQIKVDWGRAKTMKKLAKDAFPTSIIQLLIRSLSTVQSISVNIKIQLPKTYPISSQNCDMSDETLNTSSYIHCTWLLVCTFYDTFVRSRFSVMNAMSAIRIMLKCSTIFWQFLWAVCYISINTCDTFWCSQYY